MHKKEFKKINKCFKRSSKVFIMGHKDTDLDAFGAAIGMCCYATSKNKYSYVILDDRKLESSVKKVVEQYNKDICIIKSNEVKKCIDKNSLLVIVDVNKKSLLQNNDILTEFNNILVIDHHGTGIDTIDLPQVQFFVDITASSTCEIIASLFEYENYILDSNVATTMLAGIVLDTNNFIIKTDMDTYRSAYYLSRCGADSRRVQYLLKQNIKEYIEMQKVITEVKVINKIAISRGLQTKIYRREDLAKIADTILLFNNIEASFVIGKVNGGIGISSRSMGDVNVGEVMERYGGGGDNHEAATKIVDKTLNEVFNLIIKEAKKL